jgi:hypothetical protein
MYCSSFDTTINEYAFIIFAEVNSQVAVPVYKFFGVSPG